MPLEVEFDKGQGPYFGGDVITGKVILINNNKVDIKLNRDLILKFFGQAWAEWKEIRLTEDDINQQIRDTYFNECLTVLQSGVSIPPGRTKFPFQFQLPDGLPSTFRSKYGGVRYDVTIPSYGRPTMLMENPSWDINVQGEYDLKSNPVHYLPCKLDLKSVSFWGCGTIKANLSTEKRGYLPGEVIHFQLKLDNNTRLELSKVQLQLIQTTIYPTPSLFQDSSWQEDIREFCKTRCPEVGPWSSLNHAGSIVIPEDLPPTNLGSCKIVQPRYCLELRVKTGILPNSCFYSALEGAIPISIGSLERADMTHPDNAPVTLEPAISSPAEPTAFIGTCQNEAKGGGDANSLLIDKNGNNTLIESQGPELTMKPKCLIVSPDDCLQI